MQDGNAVMGPVAVISRAACSARRLRSTLLIALVVGLAATALAASIVVRSAAADRVDAAFRRADGADLVLYITPAAVRELEDTLVADPHVVRVGEAVTSFDAELADQARTPIEIRTSPTTGSLNAPVVTKGRAPRGEDETLFDAALASDAGIALGDEVIIVIDGGRRTLDVVGLGYDFSDCLYPQCDPAHVWVTAATIAGLSASEAATMVPVDLTAPSAVTPVLATVRAQLGDRLLGSNDWADTRGDLLVETDFFGAFLGAFGLFVLVASAIVIASAIAARTMARRRTIALYKAVGFTSAQLMRSVLLEHVLIALGASVAGWVTATWLSPLLRIGGLRLLETGRIDWNLSALLITSGVTTSIVAVATIVPAWRGGRVDVTSALGGPMRKRLRLSGWSKSVRTAEAPVPVAFAFAAIASRPMRTAFNVIAIVIAVIAAIVSVSIMRSIEVVVFDPALAGDPADVELDPADGASSDAITRTLDRARGVGAWYSFVDDTATIAGAGVHVRAVGGDPATNGFVVGAGRLPSRTGEAAAGYGLLSQRGWHLGDRVTIAFDEASFDVKLVGWYRESEDSGEMLQVRMEDYARVVAQVDPVFGVIATPATTTDELATTLTEAFGEGTSLRPNVPDASGVRPFRVALWVMTVLIAVVAVAHVTASTLTTQRESRRRQGIQRAIGMESRQLLSEALVHGSVLAALALLVGMPLGWFAQRSLGDLLTSEIGIGPGLMFGPAPIGLFLIGTATVALTTFATAAAILPSLRDAPDSLLLDE
jgi:putative ABC transport system permease protein